MPNTFSSIHLHLIFAVKYRDAILAGDWREPLYRYIGGVVKSKGAVPVEIGGWVDHIHMLVGMPTTMTVAELVKSIKLASNKWIQPRIKCKFAWQDGYGCFSLSPTHIEPVREYIRHQAEHHRAVDFRDEYLTILRKNFLEVNEDYIFNPLQPSSTDKSVECHDAPLFRGSSTPGYPVIAPNGAFQSPSSDSTAPSNGR